MDPDKRNGGCVGNWAEIDEEETLIRVYYVRKISIFNKRQQQHKEIFDICLLNGTFRKC